MSVQFKYDTTTIKLQNPDRDNSDNIRRYQALNRSAGGPLYVYKKGIRVNTVSLTFSELRQEEKDLLLSFFDTVEASFSIFEYTDHNNKKWNARFLTDQLNFSEVDDEEKSSGTYQPSGSGQAYPTTVREKGTWSIDFELELEVIPE